MAIGAHFGSSPKLEDSEQPDNAAQTNPEQKNSGGGLSISFSWTNNSVDAEWDKPNCKKPRDHDEADLCQQRSMAKSARVASFIADKQFYAGLAGVYFLLMTLYFARESALASRESAKAAIDNVQFAEQAANEARRSADTAENSMINIDRPWLSVHVDIAGPLVIPAADDRDITLSIIYRAENVGKTPAVYVNINIDLVAGYAGISDAEDEARSNAGAFSIASRLVGGRALFPGEKIAGTNILKMPLADFRAFIKQWNSAGSHIDDHSDRQCLAVTARVTYLIAADPKFVGRYTFSAWTLAPFENDRGFTDSPRLYGVDFLQFWPAPRSGSIS
ncbi:hypothetical protein [Allostella humosa]|uniref:hypothetical protein n=1 Tax=Stella humosa TaxID=94 RepID=UPI001154D1CA|nr:hypothetical protein [Stella humosa]